MLSFIVLVLTQPEYEFRVNADRASTTFNGVTFHRTETELLLSDGRHVRLVLRREGDDWTAPVTEQRLGGIPGQLREVQVLRVEESDDTLSGALNGSYLGRLSNGAHEEMYFTVEFCVFRRPPPATPRQPVPVSMVLFVSALGIVALAMLVVHILFLIDAARAGGLAGFLLVLLVPLGWVVVAILHWKNLRRLFLVYAALSAGLALMYLAMPLLFPGPT